MAARVAGLYTTPVKSLRIQSVQQARIGKPGIVGDRTFLIVDDRGGLVTIREHFPLVQLAASYDDGRDHLALTMADGGCIEGSVELGDQLVVRMFGARDVPCRDVVGPWAAALTAFAGRPLRLAKTPPGQGFDGFPVSVCSMESVQRLAEVAGVAQVDERRFRQNIMIDGVEPHEEDSWIGRAIQAGGVILRMKMRDERCVVTTRNPETGDHDLDTLKVIARYRTDQPKEANFGVYATVAREGVVSVGDRVELVAAGSAK